MEGLNTIYGGQTLGPDTFEAGRYLPEAGFVPVNDPSQVNAIRADASYAGFGSLLAGAAFGQHTLGTRADALATRSVGGTASQVECFLPFVLPDCLFSPQASIEEQFVEVGPHTTNNLMAWADPEKANANTVRSYFTHPDSACNPLGVGDDMDVMNGVANTVASTIADTLNGRNPGLTPSPWPEEFLGPRPPREEPYAFSQSDLNSWDHADNTFSGPLALVACDENGQPPDQWNSRMEITGFTWATVYDVGNPADAGPGQGQRAIKVRLDFGTATSPDAKGNVVTKDSPPTLVY